MRSVPVIVAELPRINRTESAARNVAFPAVKSAAVALNKRSVSEISIKLLLFALIAFSTKKSPAVEIVMFPAASIAFPLK